jgi:hypothetical protein
MVGAYSATKHAVQAIAEAMQDELRPFGDQKGPFRNIFPEASRKRFRQYEKAMLERTI